MAALDISERNGQTQGRVGPDDLYGTRISGTKFVMRRAYTMPPHEQNMTMPTTKIIPNDLSHVAENISGS
jgi:hypothetical protein